MMASSAAVGAVADHSNTKNITNPRTGKSGQRRNSCPTQGVTTKHDPRRRRSRCSATQPGSDNQRNNFSTNQCKEIFYLKHKIQSQSPLPRMLFLVASCSLLLLVLFGHPVSSASISLVRDTNNSSSTNSSSSAGGNSDSGTTGYGSIPSPTIRLPSNSLIKYTAYRDVSILHFQVPRDTRTLYFSFRAHQEFKSAFCKY